MADTTITLTIPAGHVRKIKQAIRKSGAQRVTLKHDTETGITTFGGHAKDSKTLLVGGRVEDEAKLRFTKKPASMKAKDDAEDASTDDE